MSTIRVDDFRRGPRDVPIDLSAPTEALVFFARRPEVAAELARRRAAESKDFDPREARDPHGRWTRIAGAATHALADIAVTGTPDGAGTVDDPIAVGDDLDKAVRLLADGKHVRLDRVEQVGTLVSKLAEVVKDAQRRKSKAPTYDLCKVSVPGTNLFCQQSAGVPRAKMPQLKGFPEEGSPAWERAGRGDVKVSIEEDLRSALRAAGVRVVRRTIPASHLRASQSELSGAGVASMVDGIRTGAVPDRPIFVTRDGYVIDGHHRWAAKVAIDTEDGHLGDVAMDVEEIQADIGFALDFATALATHMGIRSRAMGERATPAAKSLEEFAEYYAKVLSKKCPECGRVGGEHDFNCSRRRTKPTSAWDAVTGGTAEHVKFDSRERRLPRGVPGGGRWTRGGAVADALSNLPISPRQSQTREGLKDPVRANAALLADPTQMDNLPEDVRAKMTAHVESVFGVTPTQIHDNLRAVFDRAPEHIREQGKGWYRGAGEEAARIAGDTGHTREQVVGAIAATSPQTEWGANASLAEYLARAAAENWPIDEGTLDTLSGAMLTKKARRGGEKWTFSLLDWAKVEIAKTDQTWPEHLAGTRLSDHPPLVRAALIKAMGQAGLHTDNGQPLAYWDDVRAKRKRVSFSSGLGGMARGLRILDGEQPAQVLGGHKVRSFYNNILLSEDNPFPDVTMDTHALSAAVGRAIPASSPLIAKGFNTPAVAPLGLKGTYPVFADAYRAIARETGLSPHQAQAIIWLQWREEHP